jgi:ribosomal protein S27E
MRLIQTLVEPSYSRSQFFGGWDFSKANFAVTCVECGFKNNIDVSKIPQLGWTWRDSFNQEEVEFIEATFKLNLVGSTPTGGYPAMLKIFCKECKTEYLVYFGCAEVSNSVYSITHQGLLRIET